MTDTLQQIREELARIGAESMVVTWDSEFSPDVGDLLKVEYDDSYWHLLPEDFRGLISALPDGCGPEAVKNEIESSSVHVWHGPSPRSSLDERG